MRLVILENTQEISVDQLTQAGIAVIEAQLAELQAQLNDQQVRLEEEDDDDPAGY
jgi:hypothetical protein